MKSWITDAKISSRMPYYTRANSGEVLPGPCSPLGWTLGFEQGVLQGWRRGFIDIGLYREEELDQVRPQTAGTFGAYFYLNFSHLRLLSIRLGQPIELMDDAFVGSRPDIPPYVAHPDDADPELIARTGEWVGRMIGASSHPAGDEDQALALRLRRERPDLPSLTDAELVGRARNLIDDLRQVSYNHVMTSLPAAFGPAMLAPLCEKAGRPDAVLELIAGLGDVDSAGPSSGLWELSRQVRASAGLTALFDRGITAVAAEMAEVEPGFAVGFAEFLTKYGARGPSEWDIHSLSWDAEPNQALALVDTIRQAGDGDSPQARLERLAARRSRTAEEIRAALADDAVAAGTFDAGMNAVRVWIPARERTKTNTAIVLNEIRMTIRELGRRGVAAGHYARPEDVMMLLASELDDYVAAPAGFAAVITGRRAEYGHLAELEPPFFITEEPLLSEWPRRDRPRAEPSAPGTVFSGVGASHGIYTGRARIVNDLADVAALEPGEVLVAPLTDAAWTPLFLVAGAAVVDVGGMNSHAVVVCRELGIPCVISVGDATTRLVDGAEITVDGNTGTVTVLGPPADPSAPATSSSGSDEGRSR